MENDLNFSTKWKKTQFYNKMEDDLNFLIKWKMTSHLTIKEDKIYCNENGRRPQL